jgi:thiamine transport system ATP-binding protein
VIGTSDSGVAGDETKGLRVDVDGREFVIDGGSWMSANEKDRGPGEEITFCVRPESLRVDADENGFPAAVRSAEFLGDATRVHLDWDGRAVTFKAAEPPADGTVELGFAPGDAHVIPE